MPYYHDYDFQVLMVNLYRGLSIVIFILALTGLLYTIWFTKFRKPNKTQIQSFWELKVITVVMFIIAVYFGINAIFYCFFDMGILILIGQILYLIQFLPLEPTIVSAIPLIVAYVCLVVLGNSIKNIPRK